MVDKELILLSDLDKEFRKDLESFIKLFDMDWEVL